jgi:hypothetical protein
MCAPVLLLKGDEMRNSLTKTLFSMILVSCLLWSLKANQNRKSFEAIAAQVLTQVDAAVLNDNFANRQTRKHVPTAAQCRANGAAWGNADKFNEYLKAQDLYKDPHKSNNNTSELARLPITEIFGRLGEMTACADIDQKNLRLYTDTLGMYTHVWGDRMFDFLGRHNMWEQFLKEDAEGNR